MKNKFISENIIFIAAGIISLVIIVGGIVLSTNTARVEFKKTNDAKIEFVNDVAYDWGNIDIYGGNVSYTFKIKNTGTSPLELANIRTSCACTEAQIITTDTKSPFFGMHTRSSWKGALDPQEAADIYVVFDPLFHGPSGVGQVFRLVSIDTNSQQTPRIEFKLTGLVVSEVQNDTTN